MCGRRSRCRTSYRFARTQHRRSAGRHPGRSAGMVAQFRRPRTGRAGERGTGRQPRPAHRHGARGRIRRARSRHARAGASAGRLRRQRRPPRRGRCEWPGHYSAVLSASWELDLWGRIRRENEAARANLLATEQARLGVALTLVSAIVSGYVTLLDLDRRLQIAEATVEGRRRNVEIFQMRLDGGVVSDFEMMQVMAEYETAARRDPRPAAGHRAAGTRIVGAGRPQSRPDRARTHSADAGGAAGAGRTAVRTDRQAPRHPAVRAATGRGQRADRCGARALLPHAVADRLRRKRQQRARRPVHRAGAHLVVRRAVARADLRRRRHRLGQPAGGGAPRTGAGSRTSRPSRTRFATSTMRWRPSRPSRELVASLERRVAALQRAVELARSATTTAMSDYLEVLDTERSLFSAELSLTAARGDAIPLAGGPVSRAWAATGSSRSRRFQSRGGSPRRTATATPRVHPRPAFPTP